MGKKKGYNVAEIDANQTEGSNSHSAEKIAVFTPKEYDGNNKCPWKAQNNIKYVRSILQTSNYALCCRNPS